MGRIIVSLVSDQTIPNVLFLKENEGKFDKLIFITSKIMESRGKTQSILLASGLMNFPEDKVKILEVEEDQIYLIQKLLGETVKDFIKDEDDFIVNLTGGTKIMSIGIYDFFRERGAEIFYLPIGKNLIRQIFPRKNIPIEINITTRLDVEFYFKAHAVNYNKPSAIKETYRAIAKEIFTNFTMDVLFRNNFIHLSDALRKFRKIKKTKRIPIGEYKSFMEPLKIVRWFSEVESFSRDDIHFITGEWLEIYIYDFLKSIIGRNEGDVWNSVDVFLKDKVQNELDVVFTLDNSLYSVECKTYIKGEGKGAIINNTIYKAQAIRREFGLGAKSILVILDEKLTEPEKKEAVKKRARLFNIEVITMDEIDSDKKIKERFFSLLKLK